MERLTKTYSDGTHGASDSFPCGENSYDYKNLLIEKLGLQSIGCGLLASYPV